MCGTPQIDQDLDRPGQSRRHGRLVADERACLLLARRRGCNDGDEQAAQRRRQRHGSRHPRRPLALIPCRTGAASSRQVKSPRKLGAHALGRDRLRAGRHPDLAAWPHRDDALARENWRMRWVCLRRKADLASRKDRPGCLDWLLVRLKLFHRTLAPRVQALDA